MQVFLNVYLAGRWTHGGPGRVRLASTAANALRGRQKCQRTVWGKSPLKTLLGYELLFCSSYTSPITHLTGPDVTIFWRSLITFAHQKKPHCFRSVHEPQARNQQVRDQMPRCHFPPVGCNDIWYITGCPVPHRVQGTWRPSQPWGITGWRGHHTELFWPEKMGWNHKMATYDHESGLIYAYTGLCADGTSNVCLLLVMGRMTNTSLYFYFYVFFTFYCQ